MILQGDCRDVLDFSVASGSVHTCVTSPPYFGLRDYGVDGQIGLEPTPDAYVVALVEVFRSVRDALRDDGTLWLNLGDSYAANRSYQVPSTKGGPKHSPGQSAGGRASEVPAGLKPKDLIGIPWRVALALQADGWYLRQDIIWHKPNPMPESVTDRCTKAHEYLFLMSKSERYYFDHEAIKEPAVGANSHDATGRTKQRGLRDTFKRANSKRAAVIPGQSVGTHRPDRAESEFDVFTRNKRSVWTVPTRPYKGAHFATFPPALIEPCVLAGAPPGGLVLDPFNGSGTTGEVALRHGRQYLGIELKPEYITLSHERFGAAQDEEQLW